MLYSLNLATLSGPWLRTQSLVLSVWLSLRTSKWSHISCIQDVVFGIPTEWERRIFLKQEPVEEQIAAPHLPLCSRISSLSFPGCLLPSFPIPVLSLYTFSSFFFLLFLNLSANLSFRIFLIQSFFCLLSWLCILIPLFFLPFSIIFWLWSGSARLFPCLLSLLCQGLSQSLPQDISPSPVSPLLFFPLQLLLTKNKQTKHFMISICSSTYLWIVNSGFPHTLLKSWGCKWDDLWVLLLLFLLPGELWV